MAEQSLEVERIAMRARSAPFRNVALFTAAEVVAVLDECVESETQAVAAAVEQAATLIQRCLFEACEATRQQFIPPAVLDVRDVVETACVVARKVVQGG